jgi:hypothetical protein
MDTHWFVPLLNDMGGIPSIGLEAETNKQATVKMKVTGLKRSFSLVLKEVMFPSVLKAINAVMIQDTALINTGIGTLPTRPARYRIT